MSYDVTQNGTNIEDTSIVVMPKTLAGDNLPDRQITASADLLTEYVGVLGWGFSPWLGSSGIGGAYLRQLPNPIDDLMLSFGSRLYDEDMMRDPQVYSVMSVLVMGLLCQGVQYSNPIKEGEDNYDQAEKILQFCIHCIDNLKHPMPAVRYELAEGMLKMGHKVAEMIYEPRDAIAGDYSGEQIVLCDIKPKDHNATAFIIDGYYNVLGMAYVKPGQTLQQLGTFITADPMGITTGPFNQPTDQRIIPRIKFVIPTHKPRNGDPRGTSHLKAVYTPWWKKQQLNPQHMAYVARFAQPSVVANLPKESKDVPIYDANNAIVGYKSIVTAVTNALAKVKGGAVAAFIDTTVDMLEATSDGQVLFSSYEHEDRQIAKGILLQTLTTEESRHMTRAASTTHQDIFAVLIAFLRDILEITERNEVLRPLVMYNYGEEASKLYTPQVSYGEVRVEDIPKTMGALAQLALAGGVHPSMWPPIRDMLGLPMADASAEAKDLKLAQAVKELAAQPPEPPAPGTGAPGGMPPTDGTPMPNSGKARTAASSGVANNSSAESNPPAYNPARRAGGA